MTGHDVRRSQGSTGRSSTTATLTYTHGISEVTRVKDRSGMARLVDVIINEPLRMHSTSGIDLLHVVPEGSITVCGQFFPTGTIFSQGQRGVEVFRKVFRPERRGGHDKNEMQKAFNPFSLGLRTYVSRNLTSPELLLVIISSILR
ncbi:uncharacterized protein LAESUDRAFT_748577 [Laetiporus sulphureus 93-53]|uniref:Cytochrome P450 n=1 Tax=Laetiporus sulphureus 93-53 TaxID=1314785 RepID=A0A165FGX7_9APHY|nr:uncharacterized protein LAESUDRAFT_748577 [Laetiporus sulphureus 93-53]KZT08955.1 hypothetical protein LAESUDRAFT_748577 [Laetiporus sulphureus 93-53]